MTRSDPQNGQKLLRAKLLLFKHWHFLFIYNKCIHLIIRNQIRKEINVEEEKLNS